MATKKMIRRSMRRCASATFAKPRATPKELIAALDVLANPKAADEDKAATLDKLSDHLDSLLEAQNEAVKRLAAARDGVKVLCARMAKLTKASAAAAARQAEIDAADPVLRMIDSAARAIATNRRTAC